MSGRARLSLVKNQFVIACPPAQVRQRVASYAIRWFPKAHPAVVSKAAELAHGDKRDAAVAYFTADEIRHYLNRARRES